MAILSEVATQVHVPLATVVGIAFAIAQWVIVSRVKLAPSLPGVRDKDGLGDSLIEEEEGLNDHNVVVRCAEIENAIAEGATSFLFTEYQYVGIFMSIFAVVILLFLGSVEGFSTRSHPCTYSKDKECKPALFNALFSTVSFLLGAVTSVVSGFLGMKIATYANARTTLEARKGAGKAFITAFRSGAVMGFLLCFGSGFRHRIGRSGVAGPVRRVREPSRGEGGGRAVAQGDNRSSRRRDAPVLVLGHDDEERGQRGAGDGGGGAAAVQHHPWADGRHGETRLRQLRQDLHRRLHPPDDPARRARHAHAARRRHVLRRAHARRRARRRACVWGAGRHLGVQHRRRERY